MTDVMKKRKQIVEQIKTLQAKLDAIDGEGGMVRDFLDDLEKNRQDISTSLPDTTIVAELLRLWNVYAKANEGRKATPVEEQGESKEGK